MIPVEFTREDFVGLCTYLANQRKAEENSLEYCTPESESAQEHKKTIADITRWLESLYE